MTPLTVACVFVEGPYPYTADYVVRLERMARRWISGPFRFVCLTDRPALLPGIETVAIPRTLHGGEGYWAKMRLFDPALGWTGRVLYLDLDVLLVAPLDPILECPAPFALTADPRYGAKAIDRFGRKVIYKFNSSVMLWTAGEQVDLFTDLTPETVERLSTDQDWIAEKYPKAVGLPRAWFPRLSEAIAPPWPSAAKVVLVKVPKNHIAATRWPWFASAWGSA